jgi:endogenous inhibitor of DNA gyrase (YacG/DUF329 family)
MTSQNKRRGPARSKAGRDLRCPICGLPAAHDYRPYCSQRCADVDLGRWLGGRYAIPVTEDSDEDGGDASTTPSDEAAAGGFDRGAGSG